MLKMGRFRSGAELSTSDRDDERVRQIRTIEQGQTNMIIKECVIQKKQLFLNIKNETYVCI